MDIILRRISDADIDMVHDWLNQGYIKKWFGDAQDWLDEIVGRQREFKFIKHFIAMLDNQPVGFCQYYDCSQTDPGEPWDNEPSLTFGIDFFVAHKEMLRRGIGKQIINKVCEKAIEDSKAKQIIADPAVDGEEINIASIRTLQSCGFVYDEATTLYKKEGGKA